MARVGNLVDGSVISPVIGPNVARPLRSVGRLRWISALWASTSETYKKVIRVEHGINRQSYSGYRF